MAKQKDKSPQRTFCVESGKSKLCFRTETQALKYARTNIADIASGSSAYYCMVCKCYHLTHHSQQVCDIIQGRKEQEHKLMQLTETDNFDFELLDLI